MSLTPVIASERVRRREREGGGEMERGKGGRREGDG
jgi:hypothetical protein